MNVQKNQLMNVTKMQTAQTQKDHTIVHARAVSAKMEKIVHVLNLS